MDKNKIIKKINATEIILGKNVVIEGNAFITGKNGPAEKVVIGDNVFIGHDTKIIVPELCIGDYSQIHNHVLAHGWKPLQLGRNFWLGQHSIIDSIGGLDVCDNVIIGAMSQIWTHFKGGDLLEGCRFNSNKYLRINKDVWFAPNCLVSAVKIGEKSMGLMGSVILHNMKPNHIYSGNPAEDITKKIGTQFKEKSIEDKLKMVKDAINRFEQKYPKYKNKIIAISSDDEIDEKKTCFNIKNRTYNKRLKKYEIQFLKENNLMKFIPYDCPQFFKYQK